MVIEKLKKEDFVKYKELIDEAFDTNTDINSYSKYNPENESYEIVVIKENEDIIATLTMYKLNLFTFSFYSYNRLAFYLLYLLFHYL